MKDKEQYYTGDLASYFGVSRDTIRLYDKMGLLPPSRVGKNRYRIYSREDLICMDYIMRLRRLNMPLEEIGALVNSSDIKRAEAAMQVQAKVLEEKIEELKRLQLMVGDYRRSFSNVIQNLGKITIETSPVFIMENVGDSMIEVMEHFNSLTREYIPKFTFLGMKDEYCKLSAWEDFLNPQTREDFFAYALTLVDDGGFSRRMDLEEKGFTVLEPRKSVHAILQAHTNRDYSDFMRCRDYILERGFKLTRSPMFRVVSIQSYDVAYYDFWAAIE